MAITLFIPAPYRSLAEGKEELSVEGHNLAEVLGSLAQLYPELSRRLVNEKGGLNPYVSVYCNGERLYSPDALQRPLPDGARLVIMPVIGGGCA